MLLLHTSVFGYQLASLYFSVQPVLIVPPTLPLILCFLPGIQLAHPELPGSFVYTSRKVPSNKQFPPLNLKNLVYLHHPWSRKPPMCQKRMFAAARPTSPLCWPGQARPAVQLRSPPQPWAPLRVPPRPAPPRHVRGCLGVRGHSPISLYNIISSEYILVALLKDNLSFLNIPQHLYCT